MKGIHPNTCIYHIYMDPNMSPVRKSQKRMNHALKDIVKEELQKILTVVSYILSPIVNGCLH